MDVGSFRGDWTVCLDVFPEASITCIGHKTHLRKNNETGRQTFKCEDFSDLARKFDHKSIPFKEVGSATVF
jgi:hypothetical protein